MPVAGKFGALPRDFSVDCPTFESYLTDIRALPASMPDTVNRVSKVTAWPMLANDSVGDCTAAGMLHAFTAMTSFTGTAGGAVFNDAEALKIYEATGGYVPGNPSTDNGATLQSVCDYMVKTGITDVNGKLHKLAGYAEIGAYTNLPLLRQVLYTFGSVYLAFNIPQSAMDQFSKGQPWTVVPNSPIVGGHCIVLESSAAGSAHDYINDEWFVTWGALQRASQEWVHEYIMEAVVLVSVDFIQSNGYTVDGIDLQQLVTDSHGL